MICPDGEPTAPVDPTLSTGSDTDPTEDRGGAPACMAHLVCSRCGRLNENDSRPAVCASCGERFPDG
jgi:rubrerythrin